uniref:zinc ribbon domain-containing protein n=1 Tax=Tenebrionibacter/Tenebrionicola group TaxID=2969848 RepID=UPI0037D9C81F
MVQRCACCGHTAKKNRLLESKFVCQVCGYAANAHVNGVRNFYRQSMPRLPVGDGAGSLPVEAGTYRVVSGSGLNAAGIFVLQGRGGGLC